MCRPLRWAYYAPIWSLFDRLQIDGAPDDPRRQWTTRGLQDNVKPGKCISGRDKIKPGLLSHGSDADEDADDADNDDDFVDDSCQPDFPRAINQLSFLEVARESLPFICRSPQLTNGHWHWHWRRDIWHIRNMALYQTYGQCDIWHALILETFICLSPYHIWPDPDMMWRDTVTYDILETCRPPLDIWSDIWQSDHRKLPIHMPDLLSCCGRRTQFPKQKSRNGKHSALLVCWSVQISWICLFSVFWWWLPSGH